MTYKSSNKKVVTVNKQGVVKAKKAGTAKIVIVSKKDKGIQATVTVKVQKNNSKPSATANPPVTQNTVTPTIPVQTPTPSVQPTEQPPKPPVGQTPEPKMFDTLQDLYFNIIINNFSVKLGESSSQIAIDLAKAGSLSDSDKHNFADRISRQYEKKTIQKTFDELKEDGIIVTDDTYGFIIKDTVLIKIDETEEDSSGITFNISCTVHGLNGIHYNDCKALKQNGKWIYQSGKQLVS